MGARAARWRHFRRAEYSKPQRAPIQTARPSSRAAHEGDGGVRGRGRGGPQRCAPGGSFWAALGPHPPPPTRCASGWGGEYCVSAWQRGRLEAARRRRCGGASGQSSQLGAALARAFLRSSWAFAEGASTCCGGASFEKRKKSGPLHAPPADLACHWWSHWSEGSPSGPPPSGGLLGKIDMAINFFVGARGKARSCRGPPARWAPLARKATSREPGPKLLARFLGASPPRGQGPSRLSSHRQAAETKHVGYPTTSLSLPVHRSLPLLSCLCFSSGAGSSNTTTVCCRGIGAPYCEGTVCLRNDPCRAASTHFGTGSPAVIPQGPGVGWDAQ